MSIQVIAARLTRGMDLKLCLTQLVKQHDIRAGAIASCVGCIGEVKLRLAGAQNTLTKQEPLEIVSMMGTLTLEHQHVHICVADNQGKVWGGHLLEGAIIDTTAELILHRYPQLNFTREWDASTGYTELKI